MKAYWVLIGGLSFSTLVFSLAVDPTRPETESVQEESSLNNSEMEGLKVNAILMGAQRKITLINGKLLKEGDTIGLYQITTINQYSVDLKSSQGTKTLYLGNRILKESQ